MPYLERGVAEYLVKKGVAGLAIDVFPEKPLWRGVKLDPGEVWIANHLALLEKNLPLIQFVTNLSQIGNNRFTVVAVPLAIIRCGRKSRARDRSGGVKPGQRARSSANGAQLRFDIA